MKVGFCQVSAAFGLVALLALAGPAGASRKLLQAGSAQTITWNRDVVYPDVTTTVGQSVVFQWNTGATPHDVWQVPSKTCPQAFSNSAPGQVRLSTQSSTGSVPVTFSQPGSFYYACSVGNHCQTGQIIRINVVAAAGAAGVPSAAPAPGPSAQGLAPRTAPFGASAPAPAVLGAGAGTVG